MANDAKPNNVVVAKWAWGLIVGIVAAIALGIAGWANWMTMDRIAAAGERAVMIERQQALEQKVRVNSRIAKLEAKVEAMHEVNTVLRAILVKVFDHMFEHTMAPKSGNEEIDGGIDK